MSGMARIVSSLAPHAGRACTHQMVLRDVRDSAYETEARPPLRRLRRRSP